MCAEHDEEINELKRIIQDKLRQEKEDFEMAEEEHQAEVDRMKQANHDQKMKLKDKLKPSGI